MSSASILPEQLARQWVEIEEQQRPGYLVWREVSADIAPRRQPRRRLYLHHDGYAELLRGSPDDGLECESQGRWHCVGRVLSLTLPGWDGDYRIDQLLPDTLILQSRQPENGDDH
ncbi:hypothetical protein [Halomonas huangheensis]|uniref:Uncharacterized protein n=1 Tax=Halomonas huangheensis TaxID=1178482 RepID=W1N7P4_9GAMM|nr:hypothetical protein [Halomonas huangheensis]ALM54364.1 hypothetical protein AR456_20385 [Halomonas huangheensis]ERL50925.1 hypothetical protein BJB45_20230 [Halomonas huangheensis]